MSDDIAADGRHKNPTPATLEHAGAGGPTYILILANRDSVLGTAKNGPAFKTVATVCVAVVGLLSFIVLVDTLVGAG